MRKTTKFTPDQLKLLENVMKDSLEYIKETQEELATLRMDNEILISKVEWLEALVGKAISGYKQEGENK